MKGVVIAVTVAVMVVLMVEKGQAVNCGQVDSTLAPCMAYLINGGNPAPECCNGVKNLKTMTPTPEDRRTACNCVKQAASRYQNIKEDAASALPSKCGVQINVPISKDVNCDAIS